MTNVYNVVQNETFVTLHWTHDITYCHFILTVDLTLRAQPSKCLAPSNMASKLNSVSDMTWRGFKPTTLPACETNAESLPLLLVVVMVKTMYMVCIWKYWYSISLYLLRRFSTISIVPLHNETYAIIKSISLYLFMIKRNTIIS